MSKSSDINLVDIVAIDNVDTVDTIVDVEADNIVPSASNVSNNYDIIDSAQLREYIIVKKIYPAYVKEIEEGLYWRKKWNMVGSLFFTLTFVVVSVSTIISFSVPQFPNISYISYLAGCFGTLALMCDRFAHYCKSQSSESTKKVNILLKSIGINDSLPDVASTMANNNDANKAKNKNKSLEINQKN
jgi:hypothetical protein